MKLNAVANFLQTTVFLGKYLKYSLKKKHIQLNLTPFFFSFSFCRRHDSGLDDGKDNGVDLTGGYYDAG